jgi:hypothetical protein
MPRTSPFTIRLSSSEAAELRRRADKYTLPYFQVQRAKMILMAAEGWSNDDIAKRLALAVMWSRCGASGSSPSGLRGWKSVNVRVAPGLFPPELVVQVKAWARELPSLHKLPL